MFHMSDTHITPAQLRAFVAVIEAGSFTAAATALELTQSGISHAIAGLEAALGTTLLERDRRGVALTEAGARALGEARAALYHLEQLRRGATAPGEVRGRLRLGLFPSVAARLLPPVIGAFARCHPGVELVLREGTDDEVREWLRTSRIDIGVVTLPQSGLTTVPLARDALLAVVPAAHPLAGADAIDVARLATEPFIMSAGGCEPLIRGIFALAGVAPQVRFAIRDVGTILALVREGLGVTIAPALTLPPTLDGLGVLGLDPPAERHLALALRELDRTTPAVVAFIDVVRERVAASARHGVREVAGQLVTTREIDSKRRQL